MKKPRLVAGDSDKYEYPSVEKTMTESALGRSPKVEIGVDSL